MSFFPQEQGQKKHPAARELVQKLADAVKLHKKKTISNQSLGAWMRPISMVCRKYTPEVATKVMDWYIKHMGEEWIPQVFSGGTFQQKFDSLKRLMEQEPTTGKISPRDKLLAENLANNHKFPPEILTHLPFLVQKTRERWDSFVDKTGKHRSKNTRDAAFLLRVSGLHAKTFVSNWLEMISTKYGWMEHYTGQVAFLIWIPSNPVFRDSFWHMWSVGWSGKPETFDLLLEELQR